MDRSKCDIVRVIRSRVSIDVEDPPKPIRVMAPSLSLGTPRLHFGMVRCFNKTQTTLFRTSMNALS